MSTTGDPDVGQPHPEAIAALLRHAGHHPRRGTSSRASRPRRVIGSPEHFDEDAGPSQGRGRLRPLPSTRRAWPPAAGHHHRRPSRTDGLRGLDVPAARHPRRRRPARRPRRAASAPPSASRRRAAASTTWATTCRRLLAAWSRRSPRSLQRPMRLPDRADVARRGPASTCTPRKEPPLWDHSTGRQGRRDRRASARAVLRHAARRHGRRRHPRRPRRQRRWAATRRRPPADAAEPRPALDRRRPQAPRRRRDRAARWSSRPTR